MTSEDTPMESLEAWLSRRPFWEQYVWKLNFEKESLTDDDIDQCYEYMREDLGLVISSSLKASISFENAISVTPEPSLPVSPLKMLEVKNFEGVNAITQACSVKFGPALSLIYGANASGKSGVSRLLCNACFSRGERTILPNVKFQDPSESEAKATFVVDDGSGEAREINYSFGDSIEELQRFSIFDSASILIHLDQSNRVSFTPSQIRIFDKVADTVSRLEAKLVNERNSKKKDNPFRGMFFENDTSETAVFCKGVDASTSEIEFLRHANFNPQTDEVRIQTLDRTISEKKALDIPKRKAQLTADAQNLGALRATLEAVLKHFTPERIGDLNRLLRQILEKKKIAEAVSVRNFDDGVLKTIGSSEWKTLIVAARVLYEREKAARQDGELTHCVLCHQELAVEANSLFRRYWEFLDSKAESELSQLHQERSGALQRLRSAKALYPRFLPTDAGVKILSDESQPFLTQTQKEFESLEGRLDDLILGIEQLQETDALIPAINSKKLDDLITSKVNESSNLRDPATEVATLTAQVNSLRHKKQATAVKDAALEYIAFLKWDAKTVAVNFAGIKMATTKKRTEFFLVGVAQNYKGVFNQELAQLGCDFDLVMFTSGEQGNTVKEYHLDFAEDYAPSQILSEGEQNACSLADFLTEIQLDRNNAGIVFDDPVTSLDHERKDKIAKRLVLEATRRQVVIFSHDIVFMSQLVKQAGRIGITPVVHWMRKVNGVPGYIEENTSPKLTSLTKLKQDSADAVKDWAILGAKEQERALGAAFDYLRSACEALIEEKLFAGTIQRYNDQIKVQNLEEVVFDQTAALKIVDLHGRISELILAHNRSDQQRENLPTLSELESFRKEFDVLEQELGNSLKLARKERQARKDSSLAQKVGW